MKSTSATAKLALILFVAFFLGTSCNKSIDTLPDAGRGYPLNAPALTAADSWRYPLIDRDNRTVGYFRISVDKGGLARITLEGLGQNLFGGLAPLEAGLYDGNNEYARLNTPTNDPRTWTTYPVRESSTGNPIHALELKERTGMKFILAVPGEVIGIGRID